MSFMDDVEFSFYLPQERLDIGDSLQVHIGITFKQPHAAKLKNRCIGGSFLMGGNAYFQRCREYIPNNFSVTKMTLHVFHGVTIDTLPPTISFQLQDKENKVLTTVHLILQLHKFTQKLYREGKIAPKNILIFGLAGSTKSSFINSCYTLLGSSDEIQREVALSGGSDVRVTTDLKSYRLCDMNTMAVTLYRIWDTWGLERENYASCEFEAIIQGRVSKNVTMDAPISRLGEYHSLPVQADCVKNCIIFFIPAAELDVEDSDLLLKTKEFMHTATKCKTSSVLVITKMDTVVPTFRDLPNAKDAQVENRVRQAVNIFKIEQSRIFPLVNYQKETTKQFELDKLILKILLTAVSIADIHSAKDKNSLKGDEQKKLFDILNS